MRMTKKKAKEVLEDLETAWNVIFKGRKVKRPSTAWERKRAKKVIEKVRNLGPFISEAASMVSVAVSCGRPKLFGLVERTMIFLQVLFINNSNRYCEIALEFFQPFNSHRINYKYIERLYSDELVKIVLHNVFFRLLHLEGISGKFAGDGTGYSLTVTMHYRTNPKKRTKDYKYVFRLIDLETGMYVGFGYSKKSEMDAFSQAMKMVKDSGITIDSITLDKYYSSRKVLKLFGKKTTAFLIPKKNMAKMGTQWVKILKRIAEDPIQYLKDYFQRNLSEAGFSADKRRSGGVIRQKREDRQEMAMFAIALLHNIFMVRIVTR